MVEEQKTDEVVNEVVSDEKEPEEVKENGTVEDEEKPAENGDEKTEETTEKEEKEENGDEDDDGESSEEELGMLEKPIEILTTKRERKSVEAYVEQKKVKEEKEEHDYTKGTGVKLGDIPIVKYNLNKADTEDLQVLHRMMYRRVGKQHSTKKNIRDFCGWPFDEESKEFKSIKYNIIDRLLKDALKWTIELLGLDKSKEIEEMRDALVEFLKKPEMNDKEPPAAKKKSEGGAKKSRKSRSKKSKTPKSKAKKKSKGSDDDDEEVSDVSEASDDNDDSENEDEEEKEEKPKKKTPAKKSPTKKKPKVTPVKIAIPAKKKSASKKRKSGAASDSEDEEPLAKKSNKPPTDGELKKVVSAILKDADLEQVTMKSVVKQVYDKYLSFDLSSRKDFIKTTVKELIS